MGYGCTSSLGDFPAATALVATSVAVQPTGPIFLWMEPGTQDGGTEAGKSARGEVWGSVTQLRVACTGEICFQKRPLSASASVRPPFTGAFTSPQRHGQMTESTNAGVTSV